MGHSSTDYESTDKDNYDVNVSNIRRSIRKGDTVYYSKPENINMIKSLEKIPNAATTQSSVETVTNHEKVLSGESLYKAFTFEQSPNDKETEKCISFWKSVMEKNLAPIKCSIIETRRKKCNSCKETINKQTQKEYSTESLSNNFEEQIRNLENEIKKIHKQYFEMWGCILIKLQRKKMNEVKMIGQSRCQICEAINPNFKESDERKDKEDTLKEIRELNKWKSPGWKQRIGALTSTQSIDSSERCKQTESYQLPDDVPVKPAAIDPGQTCSTDIAKTEPPLNFEFKNIIEEKKEKGIYSNWRDNKLEKPCNCGFAATCICNKNPAIESVTLEAVAEKRSESEDGVAANRPRISSILKTKKDSDSVNPSCTCSDPKCYNNQIARKTEDCTSSKRSTISTKQLKLLPEPTAVVETDYPLLSSPTNLPAESEEVVDVRKRFSILKVKRDSTPLATGCTCTAPTCNCVRTNTTEATRDSIKPTDTSIEVPIRRKSSIKRNSLELIRKRLSSSSHPSPEPLDQSNLEKPTDHPLVSPPTNLPPESEEIVKARKQFSILKVKEESIPITTSCACRASTCHCVRTNPTETRSASIKPTDISIGFPDTPMKSRTSIKRDSLELIRRRLSSSSSHPSPEPLDQSNLKNTTDDESKRKSSSREFLEIIFQHAPKLSESTSDQTSKTSKVSAQE